MPVAIHAEFNFDLSQCCDRWGKVGSSVHPPLE